MKTLAHNFDLLTQNVSNQVKQAKLNSAPKGNAAKVAADVNLVDTAALEQIENAKQALSNAQKTGTSTATEDVLINIGVQQAEILNTVADLPTETVEARLMDGLSGNMQPVSVVNADGSVTEIPVPNVSTIVQQTLQDGWVRLSEYFPNIAVTKEFKDKIETQIIKPTIEGLKKDRLPYKGFVFIGLIKVGNEPPAVAFDILKGKIQI